MDDTPRITLEKSPSPQKPQKPLQKNSLFARGLLALIRGYQVVISPFMGKRCRYYPSCSAYTVTAIRRFGGLRGGFLGAARICTCNGLGRGGHDPVPETWRNPFVSLFRKLFAKTPPACDKNTCRHS